MWLAHAAGRLVARVFAALAKASNQLLPQQLGIAPDALLLR